MNLLAGFHLLTRSNVFNLLSLSQSRPLLLPFLHLNVYRRLQHFLESWLVFLMNCCHQKKDVVEIPKKENNKISVLKCSSWSTFGAKSRGMVVITKGGGKCQTYTTFIWGHPSLLSTLPRLASMHSVPWLELQLQKKKMMRWRDF